MKILFITSRIPFPPYRGDKVRTFRLIKELYAHGHEITLISFISSNKEKEFESNLQQYCKKIVLIKLTLFKSILNCLAGIFSSLPFQILYFQSNAMKRAIRSLMDLESFDLVHIHLIRMIEYVKKYEEIVRVVDLTDAGSLYLMRFLEHEKSFLKRNLIAIELQRLRKYEDNIKYFQNNIVCSEIDKQYLLNAVPEAKISVIYNGIDLSQINSTYDAGLDTKRLIFTGNLTYFPNIDAVNFFVNEIFPMILEREPSTSFFIVGQNPPKSIRALASRNIVVTGFVENIFQEYLKSTVAVAPIRFGAGSQFKILEALALGVPVVTTSITAQGIGSLESNIVLVADKPEDFAASILTLFRDVELRKKLSTKGRQMICEKYSIETVGNQLNELYVGLTDKL